jgi:selenophosphate synthase
MLTSGDLTNHAYVGDDIEIAERLGKELRCVLYDPQTAGGTLISIASDRVKLSSGACDKLTHKQRDSDELSNKDLGSLFVLGRDKVRASFLRDASTPCR